MNCNSYGHTVAWPYLDSHPHLPWRAKPFVTMESLKSRLNAEVLQTEHQVRKTLYAAQTERIERLKTQYEVLVVLLEPLVHVFSTLSLRIKGQSWFCCLSISPQSHLPRTPPGVVITPGWLIWIPIAVGSPCMGSLYCFEHLIHDLLN